MAVRNTRGTASRPGSRPAGRPAKAAPAKSSRDVTQYADKPATGYHKAFASWIVKEVGFSLEGLSPKAAFLAGVSIATAARAAFQESDFLEEWREKNGESKPGPKPAAAKAAPTRRQKPAPEPEPEEDDEEWEEDETEEDEFDSEDDSDEESDEEDWDDEEEPAPAPKPRAGRGPVKPSAPAGKSRTASGAAPRRAPAKATSGRKPKPAADDDAFIF